MFKKRHKQLYNNHHVSQNLKNPQNQQSTHNTQNPRFLKWAAFFGGLAFYTPVAPLFFLDRGVSLSLMVLAQAVYSVAVIASEVPTGAIGDKFGHRRSIILGGLMEVLGIASMLLIPNVIGLFIGYTLLGIGASFQSGSVEALLYESLQTDGAAKKYRRHFSQVLSNDTLAFAVGTAVVGVVYGLYGKPAIVPLIVCSLVSKAVATFCFTRLREVRSISRPAVNVTPSDATLWQTFASSLRHIRTESFLQTIVYVKVLTLTAQYVLLSVYQSHFSENGVSPYFIGFVLTLGGLANAVAMRHIHRVEHVLSLDKAVLAFGALMSLTYAAFASVTNPIYLVGLFVFLQAQYNLLDPIISDYINDKTSVGIRATVLSGISLIRSIGNLLSKLLLGLAVAGVGVGGMLRVQAAYLFVGTLLSYWLLRRCGCAYRLSDDLQGK